MSGLLTRGSACALVLPRPTTRRHVRDAGQERTGCVKGAGGLLPEPNLLVEMPEHDVKRRLSWILTEA